MSTLEPDGCGAMGKRDYRALYLRSGRPDRGAAVHLVREDAETALCGIPRAALGPGEGFSDLVCPTCLDWLPRRIAFSAAFPRVAKA